MTVSITVLQDHLNDVVKTLSTGWPEQTIEAIDRLCVELGELRAQKVKEAAGIGSDPDVAVEEPEPLRLPIWETN